MRSTSQKISRLWTRVSDGMLRSPLMLCLVSWCGGFERVSGSVCVCVCVCVSVCVNV